MPSVGRRAILRRDPFLYGNDSSLRPSSIASDAEINPEVKGLRQISTYSRGVVVFTVMKIGRARGLQTSQDVAGAGDGTLRAVLNDLDGSRGPARDVRERVVVAGETKDIQDHERDRLHFNFSGLPTHLYSLPIEQGVGERARRAWISVLVARVRAPSAHAPAASLFRKGPPRLSHKQGQPRGRPMSRTSLRILLIGMSLTIGTVAFGFMAKPAVDAATADCRWNDVPTTPTPKPSTTFVNQKNFVDNDADGVPDGWGSSTDYTRAECERFTGTSNDGDSLVKQTILSTSTNPNAPNDGSADVSIQRVFHATRDQVYTVSAEVDIGQYPWTGNEEDDFRGRLKVQPCTSMPCSFAQLRVEFLADLCISQNQDHDSTEGSERCVQYDEQTTNWKTLTITTPPLPADTKYLVIAWRVREHHSDSSWGNGRLTRIVAYRSQ